jgi:hypothetical protein
MGSKRALGEMLISSASNRVLQIDADKVSRGSFYTTDPSWLNEPVGEFLNLSLAASGGKVLDPFAGDGHLLDLVRDVYSKHPSGIQTFGLDIQGSRWPANDSLLGIPNRQNALILTNPPYLANHSARRKGVETLVSKYFLNSNQDNLYKIALEKALGAADFVIAIVPETFLLSSFDKSRLVRAVVIESDLFGDTEAPALVACFGPDKKNDSEIYVGNSLALQLSELIALRNIKVEYKNQIIFNSAIGQIGLRAVDASGGDNPIQFYSAADFGYSSEKIKVSSRLMTYIELPDISDSEMQRIVASANYLLQEIRGKSKDLVLAPFKGNNKQGLRRRRLDYALARKLLNLAISS